MENLPWLRNGYIFLGDSKEQRKKDDEIIRFFQNVLNFVSIFLNNLLNIL